MPDWEVFLGVAPKFRFEQSTCAYCLLQLGTFHSRSRPHISRSQSNRFAYMALLPARLNGAYQDQSIYNSAILRARQAWNAPKTLPVSGSLWTIVARTTEFRSPQGTTALTNSVDSRDPRQGGQAREEECQHSILTAASSSPPEETDTNHQTQERRGRYCRSLAVRNQAHCSWTGSETSSLPPGQLRGSPAAPRCCIRPWIALSLARLASSLMTDGPADGVN